MSDERYYQVFLAMAMAFFAYESSWSSCVVVIACAFLCAYAMYEKPKPVDPNEIESMKAKLSEVVSKMNSLNIKLGFKL